MSNESYQREKREEREERYERKMNRKKFWMWVGVIILCLILFFWIFDIGIFLGPNQ